MRRYELRLPTPPSGNRGQRLGRGHFYTPAKVLAFEQAVAVIARNARVRLIQPPATVRVHVVWYRGRRAGDLDNRLKVTLDSLQGICYANDAQVVGITAERRDDKDDPRLMVTIEEVAA